MGYVILILGILLCFWGHPAYWCSTSPGLLHLEGLLVDEAINCLGLLERCSPPVVCGAVRCRVVEELLVCFTSSTGLAAAWPTPPDAVGTMIVGVLLLLSAS